jgi:hypothetical protein
VINRIHTLPEVVFSVEMKKNESRHWEHLLVYRTREEAQRTVEMFDSANPEMGKHRVATHSRARLAKRAAAGEMHWIGLSGSLAEPIYISTAYSEALRKQALGPKS